MEDVRRGFVQCLNAEGVSARLAIIVKVEEQHREQHQHRAEQRIKEKLDRGIKLARAAPDADQQIHRNQHRFPENEEQKEIQRHEDAQHTGLENQKPNVIFLHPVLDRLP